MTTTTWITDIALILIVFRQLREGPLTPKSYLLPLGIVTFVGFSYLDTVPTGGNDLVLIGALMGVGAALGIGGGVFTWMRRADGHVLIKAGFVSAALWVIGMGARLGFQLWVDHGGAADIARFSVDHRITGAQAWVAALVLMALTEVVTRLATIFLRSRRQAPAQQSAAAAQTAVAARRSA
ncbi:hypothetical protein ACFWIB_23430 [Streptomyces sp. NPDC127051]|uniref:hypothetical protein n=1 Tax=Streptomyces sp. NPDC127051 TaxID=3347119 RepID=UPI00364EEBAC